MQCLLATHALIVQEGLRPSNAIWSLRNWYLELPSSTLMLSLYGQAAIMTTPKLDQSMSIMPCMAFADYLFRFDAGRL